MKNIPDLTKWEHYKRRSPALIEKTEYPDLVCDFYRTEIDNQLWSCGIYLQEEKPVLIAWGLKSSPHCSNHAIWVNGTWSTPQVGCPTHSLIVKSGDTYLSLTAGSQQMLYKLSV